jgi:hypothetical protein
MFLIFKLNDSIVIKKSDPSVEDFEKLGIKFVDLKHINDIESEDTYCLCTEEEVIKILFKEDTRNIG